MGRQRPGPAVGRHGAASSSKRTCSASARSRPRAAASTTAASACRRKGRALLEAGIARNGLSLIDPKSLDRLDRTAHAGLRGAARGRPIKAYVNIGGGTASVGTHVGKKQFEPGPQPRRSRAAPAGRLGDAALRRRATCRSSTSPRSRSSRKKYGLPRTPRGHAAHRREQRLRQSRIQPLARRRRRRAHPARPCSPSSASISVSASCGSRRSKSQHPAAADGLAAPPSSLGLVCRSVTVSRFVGNPRAANGARGPGTGPGPG